MGELGYVVLEDFEQEFALPAYCVSCGGPSNTTTMARGRYTIGGADMIVQREYTITVPYCSQCQTLATRSSTTGAIQAFLIKASKWIASLAFFLVFFFLALKLSMTTSELVQVILLVLLFLVPFIVHKFVIARAFRILEAKIMPSGAAKDRLDRAKNPAWIDVETSRLYVQNLQWAREFADLNGLTFQAF